MCYISFEFLGSTTTTCRTGVKPRSMLSIPQHITIIIFPLKIAIKGVSSKYLTTFGYPQIIRFVAHGPPHTTGNTVVFPYSKEDSFKKLWFAETMIHACLGFHVHKMLGHHALTRAGRDLQMRPDGFVEISILSTRMGAPQELVALA